MRLSIACAVGISSLLAGCATTYTSTHTSSPPLRTYSTQTRLRAADTLAKLPSDDPLVLMMGDYGNLRRALRRGQQHGR